MELGRNSLEVLIDLVLPLLKEPFKSFLSFKTFHLICKEKEETSKNETNIIIINKYIERLNSQWIRIDRVSS